MSDTRGARLSPNAMAAIVLGLLVVALLLWQRPWDGDADTDVVAVPDDAPSLISAQLRDLSDARTREQFVAAAGGGERARAFAVQAWDARGALGVSDVELRYVDGGEVADRSDGSTLAEVRVSWRTDQDSVVTGTSVRDAVVDLRLDPRPDGSLAVRSARARESSLPLWLAGDVAVERADGIRVIAIDGGVPDLPVARMAATARGAVLDADPGATGDVTVVSPRTQTLTAQVVGRPQSAVERIAAVTTTVDGSTRSARVVVLNPDVFATMDARAGQVVVTHEATHLLTETVGTDVEPWVAEGYADWVALRGDDAPLSLSAGQVLRQVEADGPPEALPTAQDFATAEHGLGAVYESAWLVFKMLDEDADDEAIVGFYDDVLAGEPLEEAAGRAFDLDVEEITARWRAYLTKSASTVS